MTLLTIAIRPEPGCTATVEAGRAAGLAIEGFPVFTARPLPWDPPGPDSFDALLLGSANALRHGGEALRAYRGKPAYAVGRATGDAAQEAGFDVAGVGRGELQVLLDSQKGLPPRLLRITGAEHVAVVPPEGVTIVTRIAYESVALPFPAPLQQRLRAPALVLLHSAAAARHFAAECDRAGIAREVLSLAAMGPRIAAAAGLGWRELRSAAEPSEAALLALAADMCHEPPRMTG